MAATGTSALAGLGLGHASSKSASEQEPLFRFGVIADIQYCDCPSGANFAGSEVRDYRGSLPQVRQAVDAWNALPKLSFVAQLGDLIDGQNAGTYGAGLTFESPQSEVAFDRVATELERCRAPVYHAIGNHELYNFDWAGLRSRLHRPANGWVARQDADSAPEHCNFSTRPAEGWTFIMLNTYVAAGGNLHPHPALTARAPCDHRVTAVSPPCKRAFTGTR